MKTRYGWTGIDEIRSHHGVIVHRSTTVRKHSARKFRKPRPFSVHTPLAEGEPAFLRSEKPARVYTGTGQIDDLPVTAEALTILSHFHTLIRPTPGILTCLSHEYRPCVAILHVSG